MLAVSLGDLRLGNSGSRKEPFLPATVLRRLKASRGFERERQVIAGGSQDLGFGPVDN